jgi:hypothetical protein
LQAVLTAYWYYTDIKPEGVQGARASGCPKTKIKKRRFEDQEGRWNKGGIEDAGSAAKAPDPVRQRLIPPLALQWLLPRWRGGACSCA